MEREYDGAGEGKGKRRLGVGKGREGEGTGKGHHWHGFKVPPAVLLAIKGESTKPIKTLRFYYQS